MALPGTGEINVSTSPVTHIETNGDASLFQIGSIIKTGTFPYFECTTIQGGSLHIEVFTADGKMLFFTSAEVPARTTKVPVEVPTTAKGLILFRITSREGQIVIRKAVL